MSNELAEVVREIIAYSICDISDECGPKYQCMGCSGIAREIADIHTPRDNCRIFRLQAALAAHEAEWEALVAIKDAVLDDMPIEQAIRTYRRMSSAKRYKRLAAALERLAAAK